MKTFRINDKLQIVCDWKKTRNGFKHTAKLKNEYFMTIAETKVCYLNRTWESFEYESVIDKLLTNSKIMTKEEQKTFIDLLQRNEIEEINKKFSFVGTIAKIGEILCNDQKEKNDWKKRMLLAGLPGLDVPEDWNTLSETEKEKRLNNVINELQK